MTATAVPPTSTAPRPRLPAAYWRLWTASAVSNLGDGVFMVALPLLAARLTRDPGEISIIAAAASVPWLLLSLPIGTLVDRWDRRRILVLADGFRCVVVAVLAILAGTGHARIWMLWVVALMLGVAEVFFDNTSQAIVPAIVPAELLERANGRRYAAELAANTFVGTPFGSLLFATAVWIPFGVDAASFAFAVMMVLSLRGSFRATVPEGTPTVRASIVTETKDGLRWLWSHPMLRTLAIALGLSNLGFQVAQGIFVLFARERLGISERQFGLLLGLMGVGAIVGALAGERVGDKLGRAGAIRGALVVWCCTMLLTGLFPVAWLVAVLAAVESAAATVWNVVSVSMRQQLIPSHLLGRVNSVYRWFGWGTLPLGSLIGGVVADRYGLRTPYFVGAAFIVLALVLTLRHVSTRSIAHAFDEVRSQPTP